MSEAGRELLYRSAEEYGIERSQIKIQENATMALSEKEIVNSIYEQAQKEKDKLNDSIRKLTAALSDYKLKEIPVQSISKELFAEYPNIVEVNLSSGASVHAKKSNTTEQIIAIITTKEPMDKESRDRIERKLKARLDKEKVLVVNQIGR